MTQDSKASLRSLSNVALSVQLAIPVTVLLLVPKCPACLAGYVLIGTGIGLSLTAAVLLRWGLLALSLAAVVGLLVACYARRSASDS